MKTISTIIVASVLCLVMATSAHAKSPIGCKFTDTYWGKPGVVNLKAHDAGCWSATTAAVAIQQFVNDDGDLPNWITVASAHIYKGRFDCTYTFPRHGVVYAMCRKTGRPSRWVSMTLLP